MNRSRTSWKLALVLIPCFAIVANASDISASMTVQQLATGDPKGVSQLIDRLAVPGHGDDAEARELIHALAVHVARPDADAQRAQFCKTLCQAIETDRPSPVKRFLIRQLQIAGGDESVPTLAKCLTDELLAEDARQALLAIPGQASTDALRQALPKSQGMLRIGLINALGQRRDGQAVPMLIDEAKRDDEAIRTAAVEALGRIGAPQAEPIITAALGAGSPAARSAALNAYMELADSIAQGGRYGDVATKKPKLRRKASEMYATVLEKAPNAALRCAALQGLGKTGDSGAVKLILPCATDRDLSVRETAARLLGELPGEEVSSAIRHAFDQADAPAKVQLLNLLARRKDATAAAAIEAAGQDASPQVRVTAWHLLGRLDKPSLDMQPTLLDAARTGSDPTRLVALAACTRLADVYLAQGQKDRAVAILRQTVDLNPPPDLRDAAIRQLWQLGNDFDPARDAGYVTSWWLCGPIRGNDLQKPWPPEQGVDLDQPVQCSQDPLRWRHCRTTDPQGVLDLVALMIPNENTTCYLYSEVTVPQAQDVVLKIASNDGMKLWLDRQLIHTHPGFRSLTVDEDTVRTRLGTGTHRFLFKVFQGGGGWAACLRLLDPDGKPVRFTQKEPSP